MFFRNVARYTFALLLALEIGLMSARHSPDSSTKRWPNPESSLSFGSKQKLRRMLRMLHSNVGPPARAVSGPV